MTLMQKIAWFFGFFFLFVFVITNVPAFNDAQGYNFGLFKIDPIDNIVHFLTALIGLAAAWYSTRTSKSFLVIFGVLYGLDAATGMVSQLGLLDLSLAHETLLGATIVNPDFGIKNWLINAPHIGISIAMVAAGLYSPFARTRNISELRTLL